MRSPQKESPQLHESAQAQFSEDGCTAYCFYSLYTIVLRLYLCGESLSASPKSLDEKSAERAEPTTAQTQCSEDGSCVCN